MWIYDNILIKIIKNLDIPTLYIFGKVNRHYKELTNLEIERRIKSVKIIQKYWKKYLQIKKEKKTLTIYARTYNPVLILSGMYDHNGYALRYAT